MKNLYNSTANNYTLMQSRVAGVHYAYCCTLPLVVSDYRCDFNKVFDWEGCRHTRYLPACLALILVCYS